MHYGADQIPRPKVPERTPGYFVARVLLGIASLGLSEIEYAKVERERYRQTPVNERVRYTPYTPKAQTVKLDRAVLDQIYAQAAARTAIPSMPILDAQTGEVIGSVSGEIVPASRPIWPWIIGGLAVSAAGYYYVTNRKKGAKR